MIVRERSHCAVCRATEFRDFAVLGHRRVVRCKSCGYVFADQFDEEVLEQAYRDDYYASADDERIQAWVQDNAGVWDGLCATLEDRGPRVESLLDIGAGTGGFLLEYHRRNPRARLFAIESSDNARRSLEERLPEVTFVARDAHELAQVEHKFTAISLLQTLEHVFEPAALLHQIHDHLEPGGALLLTVPNNRSVAATLKGTGDPLCYGNPTHLQFFGRRQLESLLRSAGFSRLDRIVGFGGSNVESLPLKVAQYVLRRVGRSNELRYLAWK